MSSMRAALAAILLASCSSEVPEPTGKEKDLASRSSEFAFKLHGEVLRRYEGKNVFISPASVMFALSMAASGARGPTSDEILAALELKGWKREDLDASCSALLRWLEGGEPKVQLEVANSAWLRQDYPFEPGYLKDLAKFYRAQSSSLDFANPKSLEKMNGWVKDRTHGKIQKAGPDQIDPANDVLFLVNAVYFKGEWQRQFIKAMTRDEPFQLGKGKTKTLPFMQRTASFNYVEAAVYRALRIPYGDKDRMAFYVFLPKEGVSLGQLQDQLASLGSKWISGFQSNVVQLQLPRFKLEFQVELKSILSTLGMKKAMLPGQADFSGMSPRGRELSITAVYHKTYVDVNEEGTEAAATTTVAVAKAAEPSPPIPFKVDRPFFCAIVDNTTGSILFTGSIADP